MTDGGWHVSREGQRFGPYSWEQAVQMARQGQLLSSDLLWSPGRTDWLRADRIPGLFPGVARPAPPASVSGPAKAQLTTAGPAANAGTVAGAALTRRTFLLVAAIGSVAVLVVAAVVLLAWFKPWQATAPDGGGEETAQLFPVHDPAPTETTPESRGPLTVRGDGRMSVELSDGSGAVFPDLSPGASLQVMFERRTNDQALNVSGLQTTGAKRILTLGDAGALSDPRAAPLIMIPAAEAGAVAQDTLRLARQHAGRVVYLPVQRLPDGRFVARDIAWGRVDGRRGTFGWLPSSPAESDGFLRRTGSWPGGYLALGLFDPLQAADRRTTAPNIIEYFPVTYQQHINWKRQPQLVRMIPSYRMPERRQPFFRLSKWEQAQELKKPVHNVFVLVHGRNEMEKAGIDTPPQIQPPWFYAYKRDVWTNLYDVYLKDQKKQLDSSVFFEFIYPTFRPVFQGDGPTAEFFHRLIREQLKKQLDLNYSFNLFIIAHSMGGVVSRAGVQYFDGRLDDNFQRLATWGTPHLGSPLVSLNYALSSPYYKLGEVTYVDRNTLQTKAVSLDADWRRYLFSKVLITDTPGTVDLRWTLGAADYPSELALEDLKFDYERAFIEKTFGSMNKAAPVVSLPRGSYLYNQNLRRLNERDKYAGSDRYVFLYGVTNKGVRVNLSADWGDLYYQVTTLRQQNEIGFGATAIWALVKEPEKMYRGVPQGSADGAVPVLSMSGHNLAAKVVALGDCDHEEYFGAPDAPGQFPLRGKALFTARRTLQEIGLGSVKKYDPPTIQLQLDRESDLEKILRGEGPRWLAVRGKLDWPGDPNPGRQVDPKQVEGFAERRGAKNREPVGARNLTVRPGGEFEAELYVGDLREAGLTAKGEIEARLRLFFKDDTELTSEPLVLAGRPVLLGNYVGTVRTTQINRDYILKRHMLAGNTEYTQMMNRITARRNEIFLQNLEFSKATQDQQLAMIIGSVAQNSGEAGALEGKYFLEFIYHGAGVVPNGFRPYKDKRHGTITQTFGDREFRVIREVMEKESNMSITYRYVVTGRLDGVTLSGTWSITENGVQILAGVYTAKRMGS